MDNIKKIIITLESNKTECICKFINDKESFNKVIGINDLVKCMDITALDFNSGLLPLNTLAYSQIENNQIYTILTYPNINPIEITLHDKLTHTNHKVNLYHNILIWKVILFNYKLTSLYVYQIKELNEKNIEDTNIYNLVSPNVHTDSQVCLGNINYTFKKNDIKNLNYILNDIFFKQSTFNYDLKILDFDKVSSIIPSNLLSEAPNNILKYKLLLENNNNRIPIDGLEPKGTIKTLWNY